ADGVGPAGASVDRRLFHGPDVDQVFADENALGEVLWNLTDHQGTVRDIVEYDDSTSTTEVAKHIRYGAFGNIDSVEDGSGTVLPNGADDLHYAYTGREWDQDAQLYFFRARWYDGEVGRFVSEDPMGFDAGDSNLNRYVTNNVWNATDPSGLIFFNPQEDRNTYNAYSREITESSKLGFTVQGYLMVPPAKPHADAFAGPIMLLEVAQYLDFPGAVSRTENPRAGFQVGYSSLLMYHSWTIVPHYGIDESGQQFLQFYEASTRLIDHPERDPRLRHAWIIPPDQMRSFSERARHYGRLEEFTYRTSDRLSGAQKHFLATGEVLPFAVEEIHGQWTDPLLVYNAFAATMAFTPRPTRVPRIKPRLRTIAEGHAGNPTKSFGQPSRSAHPLPERPVSPRGRIDVRQYDTLNLGSGGEFPTGKNVLHVNIEPSDLPVNVSGGRLIHDATRLHEVVPSNHFLRVQANHMPGDPKLAQGIVNQGFQSLKPGGTGIFSSSSLRNVGELMEKAGFKNIEIVRPAPRTTYQGRTTLPAIEYRGTKPN
ncbi:MAG: RHS repeat-associated core domain-containing protein, partial [Parvibaculaceae bacterium]